MNNSLCREICFRWTCWSIILFSIFGSTLFNTYGYNDDYHFIIRANHGKLLPFHNEIWEDGRPLMSLLFSGAFRLISSVEQLAWLRFICLLMVIATVGTLDKILREGKFSNYFSKWAALGICLTPPFGVLVAWAGGGLHNLLANLAALWAAIWFQQATNSKAFAFRWEWIPVLLLLLSSFFLYQISGAFFLLGLTLFNWHRAIDSQQVKRFLVANILYFLCGIFYYAVVRFWLVSIEGRLGLEHQIWNRLQFIVDEVLQPSLLGWLNFLPTFSHLWLIFPLIVLVAAGLSRNLTGNENLQLKFASIGARILWISTIIAAAAGPLMLAKYIYPVFRSQVAIHSLCILLLLLGWDRIFKGSRIAMTTAIIALALPTTWHVWTGIVQPNTFEYGKVSEAMKAKTEDIPSQIVYRLPPHTLGTNPQYHNILEYRQLSSQHKQVTRGFLQCILRDLYVTKDMSIQEKRINSERVDQIKVFTHPTNENREAVEIDGFQLVMGPPVKQINHHFWGKLSVFANGWVSSEWFGNFDIRNEPAVYHHDFAWIIMQGKDDAGGLYLHFDHIGNVYINPETFPLIARTEDQNHLLVNFEITNEAWYFNFTKESHEFIQFHFHQTD